MERPKTIHGNSVQAKRLYDVIVDKNKQAIGMYRPDLGTKSCVLLIFWSGSVGFREPKDVEFVRLNKNESIIV